MTVLPSTTTDTLIAIGPHLDHVDKFLSAAFFAALLTEVVALYRRRGVASGRGGNWSTLIVAGMFLLGPLKVAAYGTAYGLLDPETLYAVIGTAAAGGYLWLYAPDRNGSPPRWLVQFRSEGGAQ